MASPAGRTEPEVDDLGWPKPERVGAGAVAVRDEDDPEAVGVGIGQPRDDRGDGLRRDERQVDGEDEDRLRATRDDVRAGLGETLVESPAPLAQGPGADPGRTGQDIAVRADHQHVIEPVDGQGGRHGPFEEVLDEVQSFLGIERASQPGLGALERPDRDDGRDPHDPLAKSSTLRASRARPGWSPMIVSVTRVR